MNIQTMEPATVAEFVKPLLINVDAPGCGTSVFPCWTEDDFHGKQLYPTVSLLKVPTSRHILIQ